MLVLLKVQLIALFQDPSILSNQGVFLMKALYIFLKLLPFT